MSIHVPQNSHSNWQSGVSPSLWRKTLCPPTVTDDCGAGRIHALMMASNVSAERSATRARQVSPIPADTNKNAHCRAQLATITHLPAEASIIYFNNFANPCQLPFKNSCKGQIKMKLDIALQQNCDQWATVWWSKWSSAKNWRVGEWCLTWNASAQSNGEPT